MQFFSTRDRNRMVNASQAIAQGLSDEGGLFVPQSFPKVDVASICALGVFFRRRSFRKRKKRPRLWQAGIILSRTE